MSNRSNNEPASATAQALRRCRFARAWPNRLFRPSESRAGKSTSSLARIFGRHPPSDCLIDDPSVSSEHCEISVADRLVRVKDLDSRNGTFIDGRAVQEDDLLPGQVQRLVV